ncbi:MAG: hypothetical protein VX642_06495 [Bdellovibrionota bacterium]|nr:hypothetical protein [Bdellovibrionota bacterium]
MQDFTEDLNELKTYFSSCKSSSMIELPSDYQVLDLSKGPVDIAEGSYGIGKYAEHRPMQYTSAIYTNQRDFHIGLDLIAPVGTIVFAPWEMKILDKSYLSAEKDYGHCILGQVIWPGRDLFILVGHLSKDILKAPERGEIIERSQEFARVGNKMENGGWFPHIHVQFSFIKPDICDMPGVIRKEDYPFWKSQFPDPRIVLGNLYTE